MSSLVTAAAMILMATEWILLVAGTRLDEMIVGLFSILLAGVFFYYVHRSSKLNVSFSPADLATAWRIPGYIVVDAFVIVKVLFLDLFAIRKAPSYYRVCGFHSTSRDPFMAGRRVLATLYSTASPNSIVIGIDESQSRMLLHQLERSAVSDLAANLGAKR